MINNTPWLTNDAIQFLSNFIKDNPNAKILEFGSGASTIWFSKQTKYLTSIEHNEDWYEKVKISLYDNNCHSVDYKLIQDNYYIISRIFNDEHFDLILIDGLTRMKCILNSIPKLKKGGVLMLDNAERHSYKKAYELFKDWKLTKSIQLKPEENNSYIGKETNWWQKPLND